jgi:hypothetical protein
MQIRICAVGRPALESLNRPIYWTRAFPGGLTFRMGVTIAAGLLAVAGLLRADPAAQSPPTTRMIVGPFPAVYTDKVTTMPHFYQRDPRWGLTIAGENYCVPTSISDSMVFFATSGFERLLPPDNPDRYLAQAELINKLASSGYMATNPDSGTTPGGALHGIRKYVEENGYTCQRLEYAGWRTLPRQIRKLYVGSHPDLDWVKTCVADPRGTAWLEIGYYVHGDTPGVWKRLQGHCVVAIGYGTDGAGVNPNIFLVDNPAVGPMVWASPADRAAGRTSRPITIADEAITLTPAGPLELLGTKAKVARNVNGLFQVDGPGVPYSHKKYDIAFLDGVIVLVVGEKPDVPQ